MVVDTYSEKISGFSLFLIQVLPLLFSFVVLNLIPAFIAMNMAKKRGLRNVPAFFAGLFASYISLFFIAMFPIREDVNHE